jgi:Major Facilitator Superfamily
VTVQQERPRRLREVRAVRETRAAAGLAWRWRPFRRLVEAQAAHAAGDVLIAVALAGTVFFSVPIGEARSKVALYLLLTMAPFAVLAPLIGPWLDRRPGSYRVAIVASMAGRVALAILLSSRVDQIGMYPLAFGLLVMSRVHGVSRSAVVPETVPKGHTLMWANAVLSVISVAGGAVGAGLAFGLHRLGGSDATVWGAAIAFAAGALAATGLPLGKEDAAAARRRRRAQAGRPLPRLPAQVLAAGVSMATLRASVGFVTFLLAFLLRAQGEDEVALAVAAVAAGAGGLAGSLLAASLRVVVPGRLLLLACLVLVAASGLWAAAGFGPTRAAVLAGMVGLGSGIGRLAFDGLLQKDAPERVRARTFARYETVFQVCWVVAGAVATAWPYRPRGGMWSLALICLGGAALSVWRWRAGDRSLISRAWLKAWLDRLASVPAMVARARRGNPPVGDTEAASAPEPLRPEERG